MFERSHLQSLVSGLKEYSNNLLYKIASSPKFQVHTIALISTQSNDLFEEIQDAPESWGRIMESTIGAPLINAFLKEGFTVYYWRERNMEVDFVPEKRGKVIGGTTRWPWQAFLPLNPVTLF
jgi:uncharacterized protein